MRGLYTAGVLDVFMEHGVEFAHAVGVSAGAAFGVNIKSRQVGRAIRYNKRFCADPRYASLKNLLRTGPRYASLKNLLRTGELYSIDFAYREVPLRLDPFDVEAAAANPMRFTAVCTDIATGEAVYRDIERGDGDDLDWVRASASVPLLARPVELDGREFLDGGIADSIPAAWMVAQGYSKNVVVLTQPAGFVKEPNRLMPLLERAYGAYPKLVELLANRHVRYNAQLEEVARLERDGKALVIRPSESVKAPLAVKDPEVLERIYQIGRADAEARIDEVVAYLD